MNINVVIYEDNPFYRNSLVEMLQLVPGFNVLASFENCNDVFNQMKIFSPNIVLMDIGMSGVNGLEGLKIIKQHFPSILVMMLTVFEDNDNIFKAICYGASGYLLKNTQQNEIPEAIRNLFTGGSPMTPSIARKVLSLFHGLTSSPEETYGLSLREKEVLNLLTTGHSYKMIADKCFISIETVRSHIKKIYDKLQVHSATEAAAKILSRRV